MKKLTTLFMCVLTMLIVPALAAAHGNHGHQDQKSLLISFAKGLPLGTGVYIPEIQNLVDKGIVKKHGVHEFEAIILANELHGHMGIYMVIGAKMGVFAMKFLDAPRKKMEVATECKHGSGFPLPCINDGITGATLCSMTNGNMKFAQRGPAYAATFTYKDKSFRVALKKQYREDLEDRIAEAVKKYKKDGKFTPPYWAEVTKMALDAWQNWDRSQMFVVQEVK